MTWNWRHLTSLHHPVLKETGHVTETMAARCTHTYERVMSHMWRSHVTHLHESCHTYEWVMSHVWMSHVTHRANDVKMATHRQRSRYGNHGCPTRSRTWMIHVTHTYEWVMSHIGLKTSKWLLKRDGSRYRNHGCPTRSRIWMRHVTHMNESRHTQGWWRQNGYSKEKVTLRKPWVPNAPVTGFFRKSVSEYSAIWTWTVHVFSFVFLHQWVPSEYSIGTQRTINWVLQKKHKWISVSLAIQYIYT